jgi:hypothetical protein
MTGLGRKGPQVLNLANPYYIAKSVNPAGFQPKNPLQRLPRARELAAKQREKLERELVKEKEGDGEVDWGKFLL